MALPRDAGQRIAKYLLKTAPTTVGLKIAAMLSNMNANFGPATESLVDMFGLVKVELVQIPTIFPIFYGQYYAYGEELWKLLRISDQPAADASAQIIHDKWESRGLSSPALVTIAKNVFNITVT